MTTKEKPQARTPSPLSSPFQAVLNYQAIGWSVVPIKPGPAKKPYVKVRRLAMYRPDDIDEFIRSRTVTTEGA